MQGFPAVNNVTLTTPTSLNGRIYDTDEEGPFDFPLPCDCLTVQPLKTLHTKYSDPPKVIAAKPYLVPSWYSEVEAKSVNPNQSNDTDGPPSQSFAFTGYWGLEITGFPSTLFHRFSNSSLDNIQPNLVGPTPGIIGPFDPSANR